MKMKIGEAVCFRRPDEWSYTPDDRQTVHKTIDGVVVEDYGHVDAGDVIGCSVIVSSANFAKIYNYWINRTKVTVVDHAGTTWDGVRVVVKKYSYIERHERYYKLDLEFWRI